MPHETPLIATIAVGLVVAFAFGLLAQRLRLPPIAGYLLAGVFIGPFTPGLVADPKLAVELSEIGVILLMFGVGLHFSLKDLLSVGTIAIPGAICQIAAATLLGAGLAWALGWSWGAGLIFGLSLSVASTVVLVRALQDRRQVETESGRIAVGWLVVEDLVMVPALVLVPPLAGLLGGTPAADHSSPGFVYALGLGPVWATLLLTAFKLALFFTLMMLVGRKLIPWILHYAAHTGSRELFRLAVLAIAIGVAYGSARLFGVSFALGAFLAGMVLAESQLSSQAARETLPLRDAFAVLFFVSVGMLFNPAVLVEKPLAVLAAFIIAIGKSFAAYLIVRAFGRPRKVALTISASLAQIGEFSFILIVLAVNLAIAPPEARDLLVAGSILSILVNPLMFLAIGWIEAPQESSPNTSAAPVSHKSPAVEEAPTALTGHAVLVGHGRVGSHVAVSLSAKGLPFVVVEEDASAVDGLRGKGIEIFIGPCGESGLLRKLNLHQAKYLISAIPDPYEAGHLVEAAKAANPAIRVIARAHSAETVAYLRRLGADIVLMGEEELARGMSEALGAVA